MLIKTAGLSQISFYDLMHTAAPRPVGEGDRFEQSIHIAPNKPHSVGRYLQPVRALRGYEGCYVLVCFGDLKDHKMPRWQWFLPGG
jgi:hypothetical protein